MSMADPPRTDLPSERLVRHVFWKYPLISVVLLVVIAVVAAVVGSPNSPRATIAEAATSDPGGCVLALTHELSGQSSSAENEAEYGVGNVADTLVLDPLHAALPILGDVSVRGMPALQPQELRVALATYDDASPSRQITWASSYHTAIDATVSSMNAGTSMSLPSPELGKIVALKGDFGPVPELVETATFLAQTGYLDQYFQSVDPGHSYHLTNLWLYDHPELLNTAVNEGLTDDQWGMVKERGFAAGPWYLAVPAVIHVYLPGGSNGLGFTLWNLGFAALLLFVVPLVPGVRSLPKRLKLYRFIYRYPKRGELDQPAMRERRGPVHGGGE